MADWPDLSNLLYLFALRKLPMSRLRAYLRTLPDDFYGRGYATLAMAQRLRRQGEGDRALRLADAAVAANPGDLSAHLFRDQLRFEIDGRLAEPSFEAQVNEAQLRADDYLDSYLALCKLHGITPERDWRPAGRRGN
ncbi:tetratricopeptide repeat protein [Microbacterium indicum]|uniref:tetratricopeptide repeat protein n=1 Tax=Microbacterium indicum TaxID=358100 RepID=UPI0004906656|nr:tetratricopeptide repeat protein [Microbacterium indicum]